MDKFKKQLNKGVLELCVLKLLDEENHYGYSLIQQISDRSKENLSLKDGTLYPLLYRLEDQGLIESYWESIDINTVALRREKPRKYYRLTDSGKQYFQNILKAYEEVTNGVLNILGGKS